MPLSNEGEGVNGEKTESVGESYTPRAEDCPHCGKRGNQCGRDLFEVTTGYVADSTVVSVHVVGVVSKYGGIEWAGRVENRYIPPFYLPQLPHTT